MYKLTRTFEKEDKIDYIGQLSVEEIKKFIAQSEKNIQEDWHTTVINNVTIQFVINFIIDSASSCGRKRTILLLDDAALTLTKEYMVEFLMYSEV